MNKSKKTSILVVFALVLSMFSTCFTALAEQYYPDVDETHWAYPWVEYMHEHGYIHGYPDGLYRPAQDITRAEFVTILNYVKDSTDPAVNQFTDNTDPEAWYYNIINCAVKAGYLRGYNDGTVKPNGYITREEAAVVLASAWNVALSDNEADFGDADKISWWAMPYVAALKEADIVVGDNGEMKNNYRPKEHLLRAEMARMIVAMIEGEETLVTASPTVAPSETPTPTPTPTHSGGGPIGGGGTPTPAISDIDVEGGVYNQLSLPFGYDNNVPGAPDMALIPVGITVNSDITGETGLTLTFDIKDKKLDVDDSDFVIFMTDATGKTTTYSIDPTAPNYFGDLTFTAEELKSSTFEIGYYGGATEITINGVLKDSSGKTISTTTGDVIIAKRDRVVESLRGYQRKLYDVLEDDETNDDFWTIDMLKVILGNDGMELDENTPNDYDRQTEKSKDYGKAEFDAVVDADHFAALRPVYEDVIRYVIENNNYFKTAKISTATKKEFVVYFQSMVKVIDAAADAAVTVYGDTDYVGGTAKYNQFLLLAVTNGTSALNSTLPANDPKKADLTNLASAYCLELFNKAKSNGTTFKAALETAGVIDLAKFGTLIEDYLLIY